MADYFYKGIISSVKPGIQRDGTQFDSENYIDGTWVRWYKNRPKKIGGYKLIENGQPDQTNNPGIIRDMFSYNIPNAILLYIGRPASVSYIQVNPNPTVVSAPTDRTPAGFTYNLTNTWFFDTVSYAVSTVLTTYILATAAPDGNSLSDDAFGTLYAGIVTDTTALVAVTDGATPTPNPIQVSGGIMVLGSYIVVYGDNGKIDWNDGENLNIWPILNGLNFGTSRFVYGAPVRSGDSLTGLLWSLEGVAKITLTLLPDSTKTFIPSFISTISTVISPDCVVSYEPYFFWIGEGTFWYYNGIVQELKNEMNKDWFFNNLNPNAKNKVYGYVNRQYGEVHWLFPFGDSPENNHELVYNIAGEFWFDTPNMNRVCAIAAGSIFSYPIMASSAPVFIPFTGEYQFPIYQHEFGVNKQDAGLPTALTSSFETNFTNLWLQNPDIQTYIVDRVIFDVANLPANIDMFFQVKKLGYPNTVPEFSPVFPFDSTMQYQTCQEKGSFISFVFTSNVLDGDYLMGETLARFYLSKDQRPGPEDY